MMIMTFNALLKKDLGVMQQDRRDRKAFPVSRRDSIKIIAAGVILS